MHTKEKLAQVLEAAEVPSTLVRNARMGTYDDYESPLEMPKHQLIRDLGRAGYPDLVLRVQQGEFDNTQAEGDAWLESPEGQRALKTYFRKGQ